VAKLLRLAESSNVHEAALAAEHASRLMREHQISRAMLDAGARDHEDPIVDQYAAGRDAGIPAGGRGRWRGSLAIVLARAHGCVVFGPSDRHFLIGRASACDAVRYLYTYAAAEIDRLAVKASRGMGRTWANNFRLGAVDAVKESLARAHAQAAADARAQAAGADAEAAGTALVKVENALALLQADHQAAVALGRARYRLGGGSSYRVTGNASAREAGRRAGASINVSGGRAGALGSGRRLIGGGAA
jgi:hypothetical protein